MSTRDKHGIVIRLDIPPDHHPAVIKGDGPGATLGREALAGIYSCYGKVNDVAAQVEDKGRLASAAQPYCERAIQQAGRAMTTLRKQVEHLDSEIATALKPPVEPNLAGQIRAHWARSGKALTGVKAAIYDGDTATMSAVLNAPAYLSGLDDKNQAVLRLMAAQQFAPDMVAQRGETADALERVERASDHFMQTIAGKLREWRDEDGKIIEEALR